MSEPTSAPSTAYSRAGWLGLCALLGVPAMLLAPVPLSLPPTEWPPLAQALACQPALGWAQPLHSWWTSAWLHGSDAHRATNLGALLLLWVWWRAGETLAQRAPLPSPLRMQPLAT